MTDDEFKVAVMKRLDAIERRLDARDARLDSEAILADQMATDAAVAAARAHLAAAVAGLLELTDEPSADLVAMSHRLGRPQHPQGGN